MNTTFLWYVVAYFLISAIGGWLSRQQKKQRQGSQGAPQRDLGPPTPRTDTRRRQSPEEIAEEMRRVMGLERDESRVEVVEEVYQPAVSSYSFDPDLEEPSGLAEPDHGGGLHDRIQAREIAGQHGPGRLDTQRAGGGTVNRFDTSAIGGLRARYAVGDARARGVIYEQRSSRSSRRVRGSAFVDLTDIARALVTMEVLGPPKALREERY